MKPAYLTAVLIFVAVTIFSEYCFAKGNTIVWQGTVQVNRSYAVPKGKTLEIRPGSRVFLVKGSRLIVRGTLKAVGRKGEEIVFSSSKKSSGGRWQEILLESAGNSTMEHCIIENARGGLQVHDTKLNLTACTIRNTEIGLRFRGGPLNINKCQFTGNGIGLRSYKGLAQISESDFTNNKIGIFIREKGGGLTITGSNLFQNKTHNMRLGDFNNEDVQASGNWWGNENPLATIFDARNEPGIGHVLFEPFSKERILWQ